MLALIDGDRPYAIPLEHYLSGKTLYFVSAMRENQRKFACLKQNPRATYVVYESRRDEPELVKRKILCRSVILEGKASIDDAKEIDTPAHRKVTLQRFRFEIEKVTSWVCPTGLRACTWKKPWFERYPGLIEDIRSTAS